MTKRYGREGRKSKVPLPKRCASQTFIISFSPDEAIIFSEYPRVVSSISFYIPTSNHMRIQSPPPSTLRSCNPPAERFTPMLMPKFCVAFLYSSPISTFPLIQLGERFHPSPLIVREAKIQIEMCGTHGAFFFLNYRESCVENRSLLDIGDFSLLYFTYNGT